MRVAIPRYLFAALAVLVLAALYWRGDLSGTGQPQSQDQRTREHIGVWTPAQDGPGNEPASGRPGDHRGSERQRPARDDRAPSVSAGGLLPAEARPVLERIAAGGPFRYRQDGGVFQNRENRLPRQPRGYYREYTVDTPGSDDRGARRIVTGGDPPSEYFYTDDHYRSFTRFDPQTQAGAR